MDMSSRVNHVNERRKLYKEIVLFSLWGTANHDFPMKTGISGAKRNSGPGDDFQSLIIVFKIMTHFFSNPEFSQFFDSNCHCLLFFRERSKVTKMSKLHRYNSSLLKPFERIPITGVASPLNCCHGKTKNQHHRSSIELIYCYMDKACRKRSRT
jgi:hypothetical protein